MKLFKGTLVISLLISVSSCVSTHYSPAKKYAPPVLQQDFTLLRQVLEHKHPALYWYTSKDSMNAYFDTYYHSIKDSMTETEFAWQVLAPLTSKIRCGHTSVSFSKSYVKWARHKKFPSFPLFAKVWNDTLAVIGNLNKKDTVFKRGTLIKAINGVPGKELIAHVFNYLPQDGYADNVNYIRLSNNLPYYHRNIYGLSKNYEVDYIDSLGNLSHTKVKLFEPVIDSAKKVKTPVKKEKIKKQKKPARENEYRSFKIDSSKQYALLTVNTFAKGRLRSFFRASFKTLREQNIPNLVIDLRSNGGGRIGLSTLLSKYISRVPFRVSDSVYSPVKNLYPYTKYFSGHVINNIEMFFISKKQADGKYHLGYLERKMYKPKSNNHYNGKVYIITGGLTFSAAALLCNDLKGQPGITLVGEETGGGWYGNSGILIPDVKLPHTGLRVRMPLYKLIQYQHSRVPQRGMGIMPDIYIAPNYDAIIHGKDKKIEVIRNLIFTK